MPAVSGEIPLLTLPVVLFPGTFLPIQVADEPRRALLRDCVARGCHVAVLFSPGEGESVYSSVPCTTGCLASVAMLAHAEDDDEDDLPLSVVLYGEQRIRILRYVQQDPYLTGNIETLDDYHGSRASKRTGQVTTLFKEYLELLRQQFEAEVEDYSLPEDPTLASYLLASVLYLPPEIKQRWLESASTEQRLEEELAYLRSECDKHEALIALSEQMDQRYYIPDPRMYLALSSLN